MGFEKNQDEQALREKLKAFLQSKQPKSIPCKDFVSTVTASKISKPPKIVKGNFPATAKKDITPIHTHNQIELLQIQSAIRLLHPILEKFRNLSAIEFSDLSPEELTKIGDQKNEYWRRVDSIASALNLPKHTTTNMVLLKEKFATIVAALSTKPPLQDPIQFIQTVDTILYLIDTKGRQNLQRDRETEALLQQIDEVKSKVEAVESENQKLTRNLRTASSLLEAQINLQK